MFIGKAENGFIRTVTPTFWKGGGIMEFVYIIIFMITLIALIRSIKKK